MFNSCSLLPFLAVRDVRRVSAEMTMSQKKQNGRNVTVPGLINDMAGGWGKRIDGGGNGQTFSPFMVELRNSISEVSKVSVYWASSEAAFHRAYSRQVERLDFRFAKN